MIDWNIRPAVLADVDNLRKCMVAAYSIYNERMAGQVLPPLEADYLSELEHFPAWVAHCDSNIADALIMVLDSELQKMFQS